MTDALDSGTPSIDSPTTPVNIHHDLKIDIEFNEESDVRNEPLPVKVASTFPELDTPVNPDVIPIEPPKGTPPPAAGELLEDVRMAEEQTPPMLSPPVEEDVKMAEVKVVEAEEKVVDAVDTTSEMETDVVKEETKPETDQDLVVDDVPTPKQEHDHDNERPTKRARRHSNADEESIITNATPPPVTASVSSPTPVDNNALSPEAATHPPPSTSSSSGALTQAQFKFCLSALRQVKKSKDAKPFLYPVDHIAMNIPHYYSIITHPMDFSTIERKLNASNPVKPDPNPSNPRYNTADEFIADVRLIFSNCVTFNGPDHQITHMGKRIEEMFDKSVKNLPGPEEAKPVVVKKAPVPAPAPAPAPAAAPAKRGNGRRASNSFPPLRRNEDGAVARPKREIHPPASKDLPYTDAPKKARKARSSKDALNAKQLEFCSKLLQDLHRKSYWNVASPFYEPVDWVALELPTYPKVVKRPMDLSTMRKRLDHGEYPNPTKFFEDFKLMIRNCFLFNPPGTPVNQAGIDLQRLFDDKWKSLPQAPSSQHDDLDDAADVDEETDDDRERIAEMESQIEAMNRNINALKSKTTQKKVKKPAKQASSSAYAPPPVASSSKAAKVNGKASTGGSSKKNRTAPAANGRKPVVDDDVLTFEQKKHLSEAIGVLDGAKLERVIQIIHEGVPEIRDSTEEIELEIDTLPAHVLTKLYNFVIRPQLRTTVPKRSRTGKGTGTGGLKRKSMDEDVEAEKIRQLEARMALFENPDGTAAAGAGVAQAAAGGHDSDRSSDSSDGSDSSGSDSE